MLHEEALLSRQDWESTGCFSAIPSGALPVPEFISGTQRHPDASSDETKAEARKRYLELRWTIDAIPNLNERSSLERSE